MRELRPCVLKMFAVLTLFAWSQLGIAAEPVVVAGFGHACALQNGSVLCWGNNSAGQLGNGTPQLHATYLTYLTYQNTAVPSLVVGIFDAISLYASGDNTCAVLSGGEVRCWGANGYGQLGDGTKTNSNVPVRVAGIDAAVSVAINDRAGCSILKVGTVYCWGAHRYSPDGAAANDAAVGPPVWIPEITQAKALALATDGRNCAVNAAGGVQCWGLRYYFYGGWGYVPGAQDPVPVVLDGVGDVVQISQKRNELCFVKQSGDLVCREETERGVTSSTVELPGRASTMALGEAHRCAVLVNGRIQCTGDNNEGQLGHPSPNFTVPLGSTVSTVTGIDDAVSIAVGYSHTCAALRTGAVKCWGSNVHTNLGASVGINGSHSGATGRADRLAFYGWHLPWGPGCAGLLLRCRHPINSAVMGRAQDGHG